MNLQKQSIKHQIVLVFLIFTSSLFYAQKPAHSISDMYVVK